MKGEVSTIVRALVIVALVIGVVFLISVGSKAIITSFDRNSVDLISKVNNTLIPENMATYCRLEFENCCRMAEGDKDARTALCLDVLQNKMYRMSEGELVSCGEYYGNGGTTC